MGPSPNSSSPSHQEATAPVNSDPLDLDVTVLAFAQWVSEMKTRQQSSQHHMQAEMSVIRNAITSNNTDLGDFKRHSAGIQQQMQSEINEIRESLSSVFMEITAAVRNNAAADQDIKLKIQSLNEQAVRNETAFAQLADAADQSQSKLRNAVKEMQESSEHMREELVSLNRYGENAEANLVARADKNAMEIDQVSQDLHIQLERRKEHLKKMVNDVMSVGESLHNLVADFGEQKRTTSDVQNKLQSCLFVLDQTGRRENVARRTGGAVSYQAGQAQRIITPVQPQRLENVAPVATGSSVTTHAGSAPQPNVTYR